MAFRTDNPKRVYRATSLKTQASTFYAQSISSAVGCEAQAEKLFEAMKAIAESQNKDIVDFFPKASIYHNAVFEGGFEYTGPGRGRVRIPRHLYFTLSAACAVGSATCYYRAGMLVAAMADGAAEAGAARLWRMIRLGMAAGRAGFDRLGRLAAWISRLGTFIAVADIFLVGLSIVLEAAAEESEYGDLQQSITALSSIRLNTCAHKLMSEQLKECLMRYATEAEVFSKNASISPEYDIKAKLIEISTDINKIWAEVTDDALKAVEAADKVEQAYTADDPDLSKIVTELSSKPLPKLTKIDLASGTVVDWICAYNTDGANHKFGGEGGSQTTIAFSPDERMQSANWKTGMSEDGNNRVIFGLTIKTTAKTYGPFGTGEKLKANDTSELFDVPDNMRVIGVTDLSAEVVQRENNLQLKTKPFVADLRFVITGDK
ncbi:hypothetical protein MN608_10119 [Microdochium nivale]|nr:hypothetical protein MN608_10119 [Microdochium nivale]